MKYQPAAVRVLLTASVLEWSFNHRAGNQVAAEDAASRSLSNLRRSASASGTLPVVKVQALSEPRQELKDLVECTPFLERIEADVGVLGCHEFSYCREDPRSNKGGFCEDEEVSASFSTVEKQLQF